MRVQEVAEKRTGETGMDFARFFLREYAGLVRAMWVMTRNQGEAEDLAQEAMARVFERWKRVGDLDSPRAYLYTTAVNVQRKRVRRALVARRHNSHPPPTTSAEDATVQADLRLAWEQALTGLTSNERRGVMLVDLLDFDYAEAGRILGVKDVTLRSHVHRGRQKLRELLTEGGDNDGEDPE